MRQAILTLWIMGMGARLYALATIFRLRLAHRYPALTAWLAIGVCKSLYLLAAFTSAKYGAAWVQSQHVSHLLYLAVAVEVFVLQARHYPVMLFAAKAAAVFASLSGTAVMLASGVFSETWPAFVAAAVPAAARLLQNYALACLIFVQLGMALWGLPNKPMRHNVRAYARVARAFFAVEWVSALLLSAAGGRGHWAGIAQLIGVAGPLACYCALAVSLHRDGHLLPQDQPAPAFSAADLAEQERYFVQRPQLGGSKGQVGTGSSANDTDGA